MKRRTLIAIGAMVAFGLGGFFLAALLSSDPITQENFKRITYGMKEVEIEAFLGKPSEKKAGRNQTFEKLQPDGNWRFESRQTHCLTWRGNAMTIIVMVSDGIGVVDIAWEDPDTTAQRVRRWLGIAPPNNVVPGIGATGGTFKILKEEP
jgi:hypothetical protein